MTIVFKKELKEMHYLFNPFPHKPFYMSVLKSFENTVAKVKIALDEQFLLLLQCFPNLLGNFLPFSSNLKLSSANCFNLEESKVVVWERVNKRPHFSLD